jgi:hypothetical protein
MSITDPEQNLRPYEDRAVNPVAHNAPSEDDPEQELRPSEDQPPDPAMYLGTSAEGAEAEAAEGAETYEDWSGDDLRDELRDRTDNEGNPLKVSGTNPEMRQRLVNADKGIYE